MKKKNFVVLFPILLLILTSNNNSLAYTPPAESCKTLMNSIKTDNTWMVTTDENGNIGDCEYYGDGIALPSDIGSIIETSSTSDVASSEHFDMNSSLELNTIDFPITNICGGYTGLNTFLPLIFGSPCTDFFDDFSNPDSGWYVGEEDYGQFEYLDGEYRILTKDSRYIFLSGAPSCAFENYIVEVDARWVGRGGAVYGIILGNNWDFDKYYLFHVNSEYQWYGFGTDDQIIVDGTYSSSINRLTSLNHMKITRKGYQITLEINGKVLGTWADTNITGTTYAGIVSIPYKEIPTSDARFDNFAVAQINGQAVSSPVQNASIAANSGVSDLIKTRNDR